MEHNDISRVIWRTREEDKKLFPDRLWFNIYYVVYPLSVWFAKKGILPNYITLLMLPSALVAASLFYTGNITCIILGAIVIQLFQIFDYCDGKVARATNQKSKYGKELDFLMHVICHPIVFLSFYKLILLASNIDSSKALLIVLSGAIIESMIRSMKNLVDAMDAKDTASTSTSINKKKGVVYIFDTIFNGLISFPYFMCVLPIISIIEYFLKLSFHLTVICLLIQIVYNFIYLLRMTASVLRRCLKG